MINPFKEVDWSPDRLKLRSFARTLMLGFPVVGAVLFLAGWLFRGAPNWRGPAIVACAGFGIGLLVFLLPRIGRPFYVAWYSIGCLFGLVIGNFIFSFFFFIFV